MAIKKVSAKTVVAEQPAKPVKVASAKKSVEAVKAPVVKTEKAVASAPAKKAPVAPAPKKVAKEIAKTKVTFTLPKEAVENAETVAVLGDFNNWKDGVSLKKQKDGSFARHHLRTHSRVGRQA